MIVREDHDYAVLKCAVCYVSMSLIQMTLVLHAVHSFDVTATYMYTTVYLVVSVAAFESVLEGARAYVRADIARRKVE